MSARTPIEAADHIAGGRAAGQRAAGGMDQNPDGPLAAASGAREIAIRVFAEAGDAPVRGHWRVPEEAACAVRIDGEDIATMMATPVDLEDFATGFALTTGLLARAADIAGVAVAIDGPAATIDVSTRDGAAANIGSGPRRVIAGTAACGICGTATAPEALSGLIPVPAGPAPSIEAIARAIEALADHQPLNRATHSVHAAALAGWDGEIRLAREDVGRHTALDKLIGAAARAGTLPLDGFVVMSSRTGFELVQKASVAGVRVLASLSAPTGLAIDAARATGMKLVTRGPAGAVVFVD